MAVRMYSAYQAHLEHWNCVLYHQSAILAADELILYVALRETAQEGEAFVQGRSCGLAVDTTTVPTTPQQSVIGRFIQ